MRELCQLQAILRRRKASQRASSAKVNNTDKRYRAIKQFIRMTPTTASEAGDEPIAAASTVPSKKPPIKPIHRTKSRSIKSGGVIQQDANN